MIRALVVDDEPAMAKIISHFVEKEDLPVDIVGLAQDGLEAMELIEEKEPDLVFLDIQMPKANGFAVMDRHPEVKYIIITAYESFDYAQQALRLGASDILLKPIEYQQLVDALERAIEWQLTENKTVNQILAYLSKNYHKDISLKTLSEYFHLSSGYISRIFKEHTQETVIAYLHKLRIEKAVRYLDKGDISIKEVAQRVGYKNLNNFYKYFNHYKKKTPGEYVQDKENPG